MSTAILSALSRARRRARLRKKSAGGTMFVVSITLASLGVMGVFGLMATSADVKAAGHVREGMHARHVAEHALMDTAAIVGPKTAQHVINHMFGGVGRQTTNCKTANPFNAATRQYCAAEACMRLTPEEMDTMLRGVNPALTFSTFFTNASFGPTTPTPYPNTARIVVELANPVPVEVAGTDSATTNFVYYQVTATIFAELVPVGSPLAPPESLVVGRGRLTLGPVQAPPGCNR